MHYNGAVYHVMLRGNRKQAIFHEPRDRSLFARFVSESLVKYGARCHAYCWMTNHVHLLIQVGDVPLSTVVHYVASCYAHAFNRKYELVGHLFQGRYPYEHVANDAYLMTVARYIHLNPVKAYAVDRPDNYPWSSFRAYCGQEHPGFLTTRLVLSAFSSSSENATEAFARFHTIDDVHIPAWDRLDDVGSPPDPLEVAEIEVVSLERLLTDASIRFGYPIEEIVGPGRRRGPASARAWIAKQAQLTGCASLSDVARRMNRSPQAISKLAAKS